MSIEKIEKNGTVCAVVRSDAIVITDAQSALDLLMTAKYDLVTKNIVIDKKLIKEEFFILSSGLAGDILQKYINYGGRIAIYGDFSHYTSKPLHDFIDTKPATISTMCCPAPAGPFATVRRNCCAQAPVIFAKRALNTASPIPVMRIWC